MSFAKLIGISGRINDPDMYINIKYIHSYTKYTNNIHINYFESNNNEYLNKLTCKDIILPNNNNISCIEQLDKHLNDMLFNCNPESLNLQPQIRNCIDLLNEIKNNMK